MIHCDDLPPALILPALVTHLLLLWTFAHGYHKCFTCPKTVQSLRLTAVDCLNWILHFVISAAPILKPVLCSPQDHGDLNLHPEFCSLLWDNVCY